MNTYLALARRANTTLSVAVHCGIASLQTVRRAQTIAVVVCAVLVSATLVSVMASARSARDKWATTAVVLVTTGWTSSGDALGANNTRVVNVPLALLADDALSVVPAGATLRVGLAPNTAVTESMIVAAAGTVQVPDGWRVVSMGADVTAPVLVPGDRVDVVSADKVLAAGAIVTAAATEAQGPAVAVPQDAAAVVATAARDGLASLVLAG